MPKLELFCATILEIMGKGVEVHFDALGKVGSSPSSVWYVLILALKGCPFSLSRAHKTYPKEGGGVRFFQNLKKILFH